MQEALAELQGDFDDQQTAIEGIQEDLDCLKPVLDFWYTNGNSVVNWPNNSRNSPVLLEEFCLPAGTTVDVLAQASTRDSRDTLCLYIYLDSNLIAKSCVDDTAPTEAVSAFYRGNLDADTNVSVKIGGIRNGKIARDGLQIGVRAFDSDCYDVVNTVPMDYMCGY